MVDKTALGLLDTAALPIFIHISKVFPKIFMNFVANTLTGLAEAFPFFS